MEVEWAPSSNCGVEGSDWTLGAAMMAFGVLLIMYVPSRTLGWPLGAHRPTRSACSPQRSGEGNKFQTKSWATTVTLNVGEAIAEDSSLSGFVV